MNIKNKHILITGANGLVGLPAVQKCLQEGASKIYAVDINIGEQLLQLKSAHPDKLELVQTDLTYLHNCEQLFKSSVIHVVLHIAGIKGSPSRTKSSPAEYVFPMLMFNTNMIKAAFDAKVDWFVYLSSVGVYAPADIMEEESVWRTMPSPNDWYPGWTKRMGELALESLAVQYNFKQWTILRPSNIYGKNDNFRKDATVISSNIWKLFNEDNLVCWGDGLSKRDFVFGDDVAQAAIDVVKNEINDVINFGCGQAISIRELIDILSLVYEEMTGTKKEIIWDSTKPNGDRMRCLSSKKQRAYGILPATSLREGLRQTVEYYKNHRK